MTKILEVNCLTGGETLRDLTKAELNQIEADKISGEIDANLDAEKASQKAALLAKLGITSDEAKLLLS
jgi:hypothetical protein